MTTFNRHKLLNTFAAALILLGAVSCTPAPTSEPAEQSQPTTLSDAETIDAQTIDAQPVEERSEEVEILDSEESVTSEQAPAAEDYANESVYADESVSEEAIADSTYSRYTARDAYTIELPDSLIVDADNASTTGVISVRNFEIPERGQASQCLEYGNLKTEISILDTPYKESVEYWTRRRAEFDRDLIEQDNWWFDEDRLAHRFWSTGPDLTGCDSDTFATLVELSETETIRIVSYFSEGDRTNIDTIKAIHNSLEIL